MLLTSCPYTFLCLWQQATQLKHDLEWASATELLFANKLAGHDHGGYESSFLAGDFGVVGVGPVFSSAARFVNFVS